jgi:hypothetical protein
MQKAAAAETHISRRSRLLLKRSLLISDRGLEQLGCQRTQTLAKD